MTSAAETMAPSCFEQLANFNLDLGQVTTFDDHRGMAVLTEGSQCWNQVREAFQAAADFVEEQLALAATVVADEIEGVTDAATEGLPEDLPEGTDTTAVDLASTEELTEELAANVEEATGITRIIQEINKYTDKHLLISVYSWDPELVLDGESVGVCHQPFDNPENFVSCWEWSKDTEGAFGTSPKSYLIDPKLIESTTSLDSQPIVTAVQVPAMFGNWICTPPMEYFMRMHTTCARLLPREQTIEDPMFVTDTQVNVMTYFSSRLSGRVQMPADLNGNQGFYSHNYGFQEFTINMSESLGFSMEGAVSTYTSTAIGLVAAIAAFAF